MAEKINYSSSSLLDIVFEKDVKGYNAYQVDSLLDEVIADYAYYEKFRLEAVAYIRDLETLVTDLKEKNKKLEIENSQYKKRFEGLDDFSSPINKSNIDLLKRIKELESALYRHGIDPTKIK